MSSAKAAVVVGVLLFATLDATENVSAQDGAGERPSVQVLVPDPDNLQYLSFWVAKGANLFREEGIDLEVQVADDPHLTTQRIQEGEADVAVLPPPMYLELIAEEAPIALVANLLKNDSINLVVRRSVMEQRKLSADQPVADRLAALKGLRIGVAPNPPSRLRALFASHGMDADKDIRMVIVRGRGQNAAFADDQFDALYAHTPYLEKALVEQDAVMYVNQSKGEVTQLASRQIHSLVCSRRMIADSPKTVEAMVRAVYRAQQLIHASPKSAVAAIRQVFPEMNPRHVETIVAIYEPAVPETPRVSVDGIKPALDLFPASRQAPDLAGIDLKPFVASQFAEAAVRTVSAKGE